MVQRAVMWVVRTAFELLKLTGLAFMVMHLIVAAFVIEVGITCIVVFAAIYLTSQKR